MIIIYTVHNQEDWKHGFSWTIMDKDAADNDEDKSKNECHWVIQDSKRSYIEIGKRKLWHTSFDVIEELVNTYV